MTKVKKPRVSRTTYVARYKGVAVDSSGNVYVTDTFNFTIRKISSGGVVTTLAGTAGSSGSTDGAGAAARFFYSQGVAVDSSGNFYFTEQGNYCLRRVTASTGIITTAAGGGPGGE